MTVGRETRMPLLVTVTLDAERAVERRGFALRPLAATVDGSVASAVHPAGHVMAALGFDDIAALRALIRVAEGRP